MPDHLHPSSLNPIDANEQDHLRTLTRSPHPYHLHHPELLYSADRSNLQNGVSHPKEDFPEKSKDELGNLRKNSTAKDSSPASESGTEADDEHFLKGLPAPKSRLHKGLRGRNELLSGTSTPIPSPSILEEDAVDFAKKQQAIIEELDRRRAQDILRRNKNLSQRAAEVATVAALNYMVWTNREVVPLVHVYGRDFFLFGLLYGGLLLLYPLRVVVSQYRRGQPSKPIPLSIPTNFDPAPLLWPPAVTIWVSLLIARDNPAVVLPNLILAISSLPQQLVPKADLLASYDSLHWLLSCLPLIWNVSRSGLDGASAGYSSISAEDMTLLYPLHRILCVVLHNLTTTSLLTAELQLFSIALLNLLLLSSSPQMQILKILLWMGALTLLVFCSSAIQSSITLAKVPRWRFRRDAASRRHSLWKDLSRVLSWRRVKGEFLGPAWEDPGQETTSSSDEAKPKQNQNRFKPPKRVQTSGPGSADPSHADNPVLRSAGSQDFGFAGLVRRHTLSYVEETSRTNSTHTPSGRRKRATSMSVRPFLKLTQTQATIKKWFYALYVYVVILAVIVFGFRRQVTSLALYGDEPFGWALGYFFGDLPKFRFHVVNANLERWICLPARPDPSEKECRFGWVEQVRHDDFGEANTRLLLSAYWVGVVIMGLFVVFRLKDIYEVDTRRKVFHFTMVGMLLPVTYIDPAFVSLALIIVLIIFLVLDLLRASQLPPLSKPIASFLAPYVDGRDFRGPVVISHIFLLIGCAIPLWLALASLPRAGSGHARGWEVPSREVSMVAGVICVGLGDAAASLIGRRYGRRKWFWGGGKSIEGSVAFAIAVFVGLAAASLWLKAGGWPIADEQSGLLRKAGNAGICASISSLTEAVLTGGNDNVIVPVVLWTCVKSLAI